MKRLFTCCLLLLATGSFAQVGIGITTPNSKAVLDISGTGKGLLIPRMDSVTRVAIATPLPDGLMVFQTDGRKGFWYAVSNVWLYIPDKVNSGDDLGSHVATTNLGINDFDIRLRAQSDTNHGLGWYGTSSTTKNWLGQSIDGPVLYGNIAGVLGTKLGGRQSILTWNNSGRVGINNANPQQALDVAGTVRAQQFAYATPQTYYLSIPFDAFTSTNESAYRIATDVQTVNGGNVTAYMQLIGGTAGQAGFVSAPVNLPQGAVITNLEFTAQDNDGSSVIPQVSLAGLSPISGSISLGVPLLVAVALTAESPNWQTVSVALNHTVRNDLNVYKVTVKLNQNNVNSRLHGVRITYTVSSPD